MNLEELTPVQSHLLGRIMAMEVALNVLITTNPHSREIAVAIRETLQALSAHALCEPVQDGLIDGIQAAGLQMLRDAEYPASIPPTP
jgi:hypothetical protein